MLTEKTFPKFKLRQILGILIAFLIVLETHDQIRDYFKRLRQTPRQSSTAADFQPKIMTGTFEANGLEYQAEKKPGIFRILIYGGSAAMGFGMQHEKSWWYLLRESLKKSSGREVEVINFARGAFTSIDDYVNFMKEGQSLQPDMVIVYNGWNDIAAFLGNPGWITRMTDGRLSEIGKHAEDYAKKNKRSPVSLVRRWHKMKEKLENRISIFYAWLENFRNYIFAQLSRFGLFPSKMDISEFMPPTYEEIMAEDDINANHIPLYPLHGEKIKKIYSAYYARNLDSLAAALKERKIRAVFVFQPDLLFTASKRNLSPEEEEIACRLLGKNSAKWREAVKEFYPLGMRIMQKTARKYDFEFLNMQEAAEKYPGTEIFQDSVHYNESGNRVIAGEISKKVKLNGA